MRAASTLREIDVLLAYEIVVHHLRVFHGDRARHLSARRVEAARRVSEYRHLRRRIRQSSRHLARPKRIDRTFDAMGSAVNTPEGLSESAPLLAPDARRRKSYLAPSSARNAIAATLVSGCVVAVLAVSGRYGSSPVVHVERPGLARMATLSDAPKQPAPNVRAALKKSRVEQPTRTAPKADIAAAAHAKGSNGESELAGGNIFTRTFDALGVLNVIRIDPARLLRPWPVRNPGTGYGWLPGPAPSRISTPAPVGARRDARAWTSTRRCATPCPSASGTPVSAGPVSDPPRALTK